MDLTLNSKITVSEYFSHENRDDILSGGAKMIPIETPVGTFKVWTKRIGNNPKIKILILHGGPGANHEYLEAVDSFFPREGFEYYHYDQLGSFFSDQPNNPELWKVERFVEEVEQVRKALKLDSSNFFLYGQSWGGILAMEYALKYQSNLKGLIISNMMMNAPAYGKYADEVLGPQMKPEVLAEIRDLEKKGEFDNPRYMELLMENYYTEHICRIPLDEWPDSVSRGFSRINNDVYIPLQGPSEFGIRGILEKWDRTADLPKIKIPTLFIGARYDTMDPKHMELVSTQVQNGSYLYCPNGSHLAMYDDQETYFAGLIKFIQEIGNKE